MLAASAEEYPLFPQRQDLPSEPVSSLHYSFWSIKIYLHFSQAPSISGSPHQVPSMFAPTTIFISLTGSTTGYVTVTFQDGTPAGFVSMTYKAQYAYTLNTTGPTRRRAMVGYLLFFNRPLAASHSRFTMTAT